MSIMKVKRNGFLTAGNKEREKTGTNFMVLVWN